MINQGKALSKEILSKNIFKSASLIGRRLVNDEDYLKNGVNIKFLIYKLQ
jgi:hypothetical protein